VQVKEIERVPVLLERSELVGKRRAAHRQHGHAGQPRHAAVHAVHRNRRRAQAKELGVGWQRRECAA